MLDSYPHGRELAVMRPTHHFAVPLSYSLPGEVTLQSPEITLDLNQHEFSQPHLLRASPLSLCVRSEYPPPSTSFYSEHPLPRYNTKLLMTWFIQLHSQKRGWFGVAFQSFQIKYHLLASCQACRPSELTILTFNVDDHIRQITQPLTNRWSHNTPFIMIRLVVSCHEQKYPCVIVGRTKHLRLRIRLILNIREHYSHGTKVTSHIGSQVGFSLGDRPTIPFYHSGWCMQRLI